MTMPLVSIEDVPIQKFHQRLTISAAGGIFVDGYVLSVIGVIILHATTVLQLSDFWQGMIAASSLIGIFAGGLIGGWLTSSLGRKRLFYASPLIFLVASIGQFYADSAAMLFFWRIIIGIGVGIEYPAATAMLAEFLPRKNRGPRLAALSTCWFAGAAAAYIFGEIILRTGGDEAWRLVLASGAVLGGALFAMRLGTPESLRWLLSKGRKEEAAVLVKKIYGSDFSIANIGEDTNTIRLPLKSILSAGYGKRMFFVVTFWTCAMLPVFAVYAFAPKVLSALKLDDDAGSIGSIAITLFFVVGCVVATKLINTLGRRNVMIYSFLLAGISLMGLAGFQSSSSYLVILFFSCYALFIGGAQVLTFVYPNEIFPTEIRSFAVGVGTSFSRIGAAIGTYLVPVSLNSLGVSITMLVAAGITFIGLIVAILLAPETRSLNLHEASALA
ncbi:metabolite transporter [Pseudomonas silesiensis]|uniref:Metabolite transporter n=1 Tax=Pseudomonas silesiensis TaxID=1853130 RepID=A0A191YU89_9PSED|nr:MFS transporter [Pseudomonas silesiensis]ANJ56301.1 metabolite transporter [Pseudomonas silesiensis]